MNEPRCVHRSHRLHLRCRRAAHYDGFCTHHNGKCFRRCPAEAWRIERLPKRASPPSSVGSSGDTKREAK